LLLLMLEPFIYTGLVHMVPDPTDFGDLGHVVLNMAEKRVGDLVVDKKDMERLCLLFKDDYMRATRALPLNALRRMVQRISPDLSTEQIERAIAEIKRDHEKDPL